MSTKMILTLAIGCVIHSAWAATAAIPTDAAGLQQRLAARFTGDRSGACIAAVVIDGDKVLRGQT